MKNNKMYLKILLFEEIKLFKQHLANPYLEMYRASSSATIAQTCSIGDKSGECGGQNRSRSVAGLVYIIPANFYYYAVEAQHFAWLE